MSSSQPSLGDTIRDYNENGRLYLLGGVVSAIVSWFLIPLFGLVSVFCGYRLYEVDRSTVGGIIAAVGGLGVILWLVLIFG